MWSVKVLICITLSSLSLSLESDFRRDITCTSETLTIECPDRQVIVVKRSLYGRMESGRCITSEYAHSMGCYLDVTIHMQDLCSGQHTCSLMVASLDAMSQPCAKDFKSYLDTEYRCVSASFIDDCRHINHTVLTDSKGFLVLRPNRPTLSTSPLATQLLSCPWILVTEFGRRFNVSWRVPSSSLLNTDPLDLVPLPDDSNPNMVQGNYYAQPQPQQHLPSSLVSSFSSSSSSSSSTFCGVSWKFVDGEEEVFYAACVSGVRMPQTRMYESKSNRLEIHFTGVLHSTVRAENQEYQRLPLLEYSAIGCGQYKPPEGAFISGEEDSMMVVCNTSGQMWHISCQDGAWFGTVGSCKSASGQEHTSAVSKPSAMPRLEMKLDKAGVITAIVVGVLLGGTFGAMMLLAIFVLKKRDRTKRRCKRKPATTASTNFSETVYNTPPLNHHHQTDLQQLRVSTDALSGCKRQRCSGGPDCHSQCLHPPPYHMLATSPISCTCRSNNNSPSGCCYNDQTQLISLTTPDESNFYRPKTQREIAVLADNVKVSTVSGDYIEDGDERAPPNTGPTTKFSKNDYLAVKFDDVDD